MVAGQNNHGNRWILRSKVCDRLCSIDLRHPDIANDDIDHQGIVPAVEDIHCPPAIVCFLNIITCIRQYRSEDLPDGTPPRR